jgi:hypothetical protein
MNKAPGGHKAAWVLEREQSQDRSSTYGLGVVAFGSRERGILNNGNAVLGILKVGICALGNVLVGQCSRWAMFS